VNLSDINKAAAKRKKAKRVGRGPGSGHGKTSGRGMRGWRQRSGTSVPLTYEGGQMPLFRRIPKRGFNNKRFAMRYQPVNLRDLNRFDEGTEVGIDELDGAGLIDKGQGPVKLLGGGRLDKKLTVSVHKSSKSAAEAVAAAGGEVREIAGK